MADEPSTAVLDERERDDQPPVAPLLSEQARPLAERPADELRPGSATVTRVFGWVAFAFIVGGTTVTLLGPFGLGVSKTYGWAFLVIGAAALVLRAATRWRYLRKHSGASLGLGLTFVVLGALFLVFVPDVPAASTVSPGATATELAVAPRRQHR